MRYWKRLLFFVLITVFAGTADLYAQDAGTGDGGQKNEAPPAGRAARRKAKREWKEKRKKDFADAKDKREYNKKYNSKKVQRRMKRNAKKAKRNNEHKREFFIVRWFKKHRK